MIRIRQLKLSIDNDNLKKKCANILNIKEKDILDLKIVKKSIDARKKNNIFYVYVVDILVKNEITILNKINSKDIFESPNEEYKLPELHSNKDNIFIVGSGPAGLFCAYMLASVGLAPIIVERGEKVDDRVKTVEKFFNDNILNVDSNVQFGEGGAGTFSDGKLNTLIKDPLFRGKKVLEIFVENGAPKEILYLNKPHIGTDLLRDVIKNMRNKIIEMGGIFKYNTCLTDINIVNGKIKSIILNNLEEKKCDHLILAIGHSARDTFEMLYKKKLEMISKPFAIGIRIQHKQNLITENQYGKNASLPPASYKLTYTTKNKRGVYSFCMCPGGYVVNASSENDMLAINGMSNHARDTENANSAIVVTVSKKDFGNHPLDGIKFQRNLEKKCFNKGKGNIPTQLFIDYKNNQSSSKLGKIKPIFKGNYILTDINDIFPDYINESLMEAINYFDTKIKGFANDDVLLSAIESRTSSPVRIIRDEYFESNIKGIYPCGEGAGYAGGITSAAIDGIKVAEAIIKR